MMISPAERAERVLRAKGVGDTPAFSLESIADSENIKFRRKNYPDAWDGRLVFAGERRVILVNTRIGECGRHNFTFAHELGHHFLGHKPTHSTNGQESITCNITETSSEFRGQEAEANQFAVELLMPENRFRLDMAGAPIDFDLIGGLANKYMVSKHACSNRILALTQTPCIIIRFENGKAQPPIYSKAAKGALRRINTAPPDTIAHEVISGNLWQESFTRSGADKWLIRSVPGDSVYECTHKSKDGIYAMTILRW